MPPDRVLGDAWLLILSSLKELRAAWPTRGWSWDARQSCVASSFSVELEAKAKAVASVALSREWTVATIDRAPSALRELAERTGGLREGQMLLASSTVGSAFAYGLWWPWGDGMTTSARIGLGGPSVKTDDMQRLRDAFGVQL
ncbi:MAG: hypothetical protein ACLP1X_19060 [Polyangiaceae bacterium]|jgi:hypothetical protein